MAVGAVGSIVNIVREINLSTIKKEAEQRFALLVAGPEALAAEVAARLSEAEGKVGVHPWISVQALPLPQAAGDLGRFDLALLVLPQAELDERSLSALRRLDEAQQRTVVLVVSEAAAQQVGAEVARQREAARVVLASLDPLLVEGRLVPALLDAGRPELRLSLARHLPRFRSVAARHLIEETSRTNALYALSTGLAEVVPVLNIPLNAADLFVLTKNQLVMAYKLALMGGKEGEPRDIMGEVVGVLGGGFLFRQIARELVGLIPVVGIVPKVAVSYAGTWVIGRTIFLWATEGQRLSSDELRRFYAEALSRGRMVAEQLAERLRSDEPAPALPGLAAPPRRWWQRLPLIGPRLTPRAALPAPHDPDAPLATVPAAPPRKSVWRRLRDKLPF